MEELHYVMYHNPDSMGYSFRDITEPCIMTNKEAAAKKAEVSGMIWCIGRDGDRYFLYQRLVDTRLKNVQDSYFKFSLCGKDTFPKGHELDITDKPYMPQIKKILSLGLQRFHDQKIIDEFEAEYNQARKAAK